MTTPPRRAALVFIFVTVALDMLALGIVVPVLPKLVTDFVQGDTARASVVYGVFVTSWEAMQLVFSPLLGALSDRFGRRPVVLLSNLGLGLDYVLMAVAPSLSLLFVGRVISGITSASFPVAGAYIADVMPPEKRSGGYGMLGAAFGVGFVIGPAVGGLLGGISPRLPFWAAAGLSLANTLYGAFILPESLPRSLRGKFEWRKANPLGALGLLRSHRTLFGLALVAFVLNLAHFVLQSTYVLYVVYRYAWSERAIGLSLAAVGICASIVQAGLVRPVVTRLGEKKTMLAGLLFGALGFATYGLAPTTMWFCLGIPLTSLWGLASPPSQSIMSRYIGPSEQGQLQGALTSLAALAGIVAPIIFANTFAFAIDPARSFRLPGAPFLLSSALLVLALTMAAYVFRNAKRAVAGTTADPRA